MNVEQKKCSKCNQILPITEFNKTRKNADGHAYLCRKCASKYAKEHRAKKRANPPEIAPFKTCYICQETLSSDEFGREYRNRDGLKSYCRKCEGKYILDRMHKKELCKPMKESKECTSYFGIYVTENLLSYYFKDIKHMPYNNPGYDFICANGYKIDSKASCLHTKKHGNCWQFATNHNTIADYFICIGYDNRENLTPLRAWLIPSRDIKDRCGFSVTNNPHCLARWSQYEKPISKLLCACEQMKKQLKPDIPYTADPPEIIAVEA